MTPAGARTVRAAVTAFLLFALLSVGLLHQGHRRATANLESVMASLDHLARARLHVAGAQLASAGIGASDPTFEPRRVRSELALAVRELDDWMEGRSGLLGIRGRAVTDPELAMAVSEYRDLLVGLGNTLAAGAEVGPVERRVLFTEADRAASQLERTAWNRIREALRQEGQKHRVSLAGWSLFLLLGGLALWNLHTSSVLALERQREAEEARRGLEQRLRQAEKLEAVGQLTGGIAHDFNNLLTVILANVELLREEAPPEMAGGFADVEEAARHGRTLVEGLLGFSRRADLAMTVVPMKEPLEAAVRMARRLIPADIGIELVVPDEEVRIRADATAMQQILLNLMVNARDAMPGGGRITLELDRLEVDHRVAETHPGLSEGPHVRVQVSDSGTGMDRATMARIFEPFFTTKPPGEGTGLGLATVHGLVRQHGGTIDVYSEPGAGTTFRIYLPEVRDEATPSGTGPGSVARGNPASPSAVDRSTRILLVDDEEPIRRTARRVLERLGYRVVEAAGGEEALAILEREGPVDLVFTDVAMPGVGGLELRRRLAEGSAGAPPFLFTSGYTARDVEARSGLPPGARFLSKPWTVEQLAAAVSSAMEAQGAGLGGERSEPAGGVRAGSLPM